MFRPTQTVPSKLTAVNIVVGFLLTIILLAVAVLSSVGAGVSLEFGEQASPDNGLLFLTALLILGASIRPLAGGLLLCAMAVASFMWVPVTASIAFAFSMLALLRAYMSRRHLAKKS